MKTIILSFFSIFFSTGIYAQFGVIARPDFALMYRGYPNKLVPMISSDETASISVSGGTCTRSTWTVNDVQYNGYIVNPTGTQVTITLTGKSKNGKVKNYGTFNYKVKPFPMPQLENYTISKSIGSKLTVGLGADCPLFASYEIIGGDLTIGDEVIPFSGNNVPASALQKAAIDMNIAISLTYKRTGSESASIIQGVLKVVE
ncbi:MAG: hypothetical protein KA736_02930 [Crocinitomicaceae bacterium]|nr:hypothetical protein [Crocinitomicaceae bacterium]MBP6032393.1 hypothetical protein [Crocinitomicaceae bacterium]